MASFKQLLQDYAKDQGLSVEQVLEKVRTGQLESIEDDGDVFIKFEKHTGTIIANKRPSKGKFILWALLAESALFLLLIFARNAVSGAPSYEGVFVVIQLIIFAAMIVGVPIIFTDMYKRDYKKFALRNRFDSLSLEELRNPVSIPYYPNLNVKDYADSIYGLEREAWFEMLTWKILGAEYSEENLAVLQCDFIELLERLADFVSREWPPLTNTQLQGKDFATLPPTKTGLIARNLLTFSLSWLTLIALDYNKALKAKSKTTPLWPVDLFGSKSEASSVFSPSAMSIRATPPNIADEIERLRRYTSSTAEAEIKPA